MKSLYLIALIFFSSSIYGIEASSQNSWGLTHYLWNFGIAGECDVGPQAPAILYSNYLGNHFDKTRFNDLKPGDIIWLRTVYVPQFYVEVLPELKTPIVLVINDGDESFPSGIKHLIDVEKLLANDNIIHIFAQNCDYKGPSKKVSHLPIGIDFHTIAYRNSGSGHWGQKGSPSDQEAGLIKILATLQPTNIRKKRAFVDFQINDGMRLGHCRRYLEMGEDRTLIFNRLLSTNLLDYNGQMMPREELWKIKGQYAFSISPHGNGLDCHRTWEDLALGCIVIVKTSPLDPMYEGLPVVIVKDWDEVNEANFEKWIQKYGDAFTNPSFREKLTNEYWLKKIRAYIAPYKLKT